MLPRFPAHWLPFASFLIRLLSYFGFGLLAAFWEDFFSIDFKRALLFVFSHYALNHVGPRARCASLKSRLRKSRWTKLSWLWNLFQITNPGATSLFGFGVRCKLRSDTTRSMIVPFDSMLGGTFSDASQASSTSEQNPFGDECYLRSSRDPVDYSKGTIDPKFFFFLI